MEKIVAFCKGRGFVFSGSEIYGGLANTWDYGPLGVEFKNNVDLTAAEDKASALAERDDLVHGFFLVSHTCISVRTTGCRAPFYVKIFCR